MDWKSIRLELGSTREFPVGSVSRAYLLRLPLDDIDFVDRAGFELSSHWATVRRYWSTEPDEAGFVVRIDGGWALRCNGSPVRMLELESRPIRLGHQVSIVEPSGASFPLRIASIR